MVYMQNIKLSYYFTIFQILSLHSTPLQKTEQYHHTIPYNIYLHLTLSTSRVSSVFDTNELLSGAVAYWHKIIS